MSPRPLPDPDYVKLTGARPRPSRAKPKDDSEVPASRPTCPSYFDADARKEWRRLTAMLMARRVLTKADGPLLECYLQLWLAMRRAQHEIEEHGAYESNVSGCRVETGASKSVTKITAQMRQVLTQLGATPASREKAKRAATPVSKRPLVEGSLAWLLKNAAEQLAEPEPAKEPEVSEVNDVNLDQL